MFMVLSMCSLLAQEVRSEHKPSNVGQVPPLLKPFVKMSAPSLRDHTTPEHNVAFEVETPVDRGAMSVQHIDAAPSMYVCV